MISAGDDADWHGNYFNYFTEIEEHFQRARGTGLFLLSPLDWALIENWKNGGVPLEAVLAGVDAAFATWRSRKTRTRSVNSLAYCAQAVADAVQRAPSRAGPSLVEAPFSPDEIVQHLSRCAATLRQHCDPAIQDLARTLDHFRENLSEHLAKTEDFERRLTSLEDKMVAIARSLQTETDLYEIRELLDRELKPYRGKMTAEQLSMLERRYLDTAVLERSKLPRLSLFYIA